MILSTTRMLMEKSSGVELELKQMDINFDQLRQSTFLYLFIFCIYSFLIFIHFIFMKAIHREQNPDEPPDDRQQQQAKPGQRRKH